MSVPTLRRAALPAALAILLAAPGVASAALGGGNALTTALRPDLRSATVQSTNAVDDTTTVRVCFSKPIASLPQAGLFQMGDYNSSGSAGTTLTATSATRSTANCADAVFGNSDATQYTFVSTLGSAGTAPDGGTSAVATNGFGNIQDSTALIGSKTNNGTRGFSTAPDLVGISVNNATASIDYTYDQRVATVSNLPTAFSYNIASGLQVDSIDGTITPRQISADGLTVRVFFPPGPAIQSAVRAFSAGNAVSAKVATGTGQAASELRSAARPGSGGFTDRPDLVAVTLAADNGFVDFQFDQVLQVVNGGFRTNFAFSFPSAPGGGTIVGGPGVGNTVRVPLPGVFLPFVEFMISGAAPEGAVEAAGGVRSTAGGLPMGGNAGAFATAFTDAAEALSVTFDNATNVARVRFDQRWTAANDTLFRLIDDQGSQISAAAINVSGTGAPTAGQVTAEITFPAGTLAGARSLLIQQSALTGAGPVSSRVQVISPTAPAGKTAKKFRKAAAMRRAAKRLR